MFRPTFKRGLSILLCLAMVLSLCPVMAWGAEAQDLLSVQDTLFATVSYGTDKADAIAALPTSVGAQVKDNSPLVEAEPFSYDFEEETQLEDWTLLSDQITLSDGKLHFANSTNIKAHVGPETLTDFVVQADLQITEETPSSDVGIMIRVTDATNGGADSYNGYYVGLGRLGSGDTESGSGIKTGYANGSWHENGRYSYEIDATKAYTLKAVVYDNTVTTFVKEADADDSEFVLICTETTGYEAGSVGLRSYKQSFDADNFQVRALTEADLADCGIVPSVDVQVPVTQWVCENYDGSVAGQYVFTGELGGDYANPDNLSAKATVTVKDLPEQVNHVHSVPFSQVTVEDEFWSAKQKQFVCEVIPVAIENISKGTGGMPNFKLASEYLSGKEGNYTTDDAPAGYAGAVYVDSDVYKVVEAMCYALQLDAQGDLEIINGQAYIASKLEEWIPWFVGSQEADGYLYTAYTLSYNSNMRFTGRWDSMPVHTDGSLYDTVNTEEYDSSVNYNNHELYCVGHFYEAAVAHYRATGDFRLLDVAIKNADLVVRTFGYGDDQVQAVPGHQEIELALVKLAALCEEIGTANGVDYASRADGYIAMAKFFLDERGKDHDGYGVNYSYYAQDDLPVANQRTAHGHCVRAQYMYTGMADVALLEIAAGRENPYDEALRAIWKDSLTKTYINGGVGIPSGEAFSNSYQLPNDNAYCETCAQIANAMWNQRMNLLYGDSVYVDLVERTLYNTIISCVNLDGDRFFYGNPMQSNGSNQRSVWFGTACCPPNLLRTVTAIGGYIYTQDGDGTINVNQYIGNTAELNVAGELVSVSMTSTMPWSGEVTFTVNQGAENAFTVRFRIPEWATYGNTITVNGEAVSAEPSDNGYVEITRVWAEGDTVALNFPMEPERIYSDENVVANQGLVAIRRGPVVYVAEGVDNPDVDLFNATLGEDTVITVNDLARLPGREGEDTYNVENVVTLSVESTSTNLFGVTTDVELLMIPYYAWCNRGKTTMTLYLNEQDNTGNRTLESYATPTASWTSQYDTIGALNDGGTARWSAYESPINYNWVQYAYEDGCVTLKGVWVTWYHDGGGVQVPTGLRIEYWDGTQWQEVTNMTNGDQFPKNTEQYYGFDEITTNRIRLYPTNPATSQKSAQPGIIEWRLDGEAAIGVQFAETKLYEAEDAALTSPANTKSNAAVSGGKYVGTIDNEEATVTFTVNAETAGYYRVAVTYSGHNSYPNTAHKYYVNGDVENAQIITYGKREAWNAWYHDAITVELGAGENTITFTHAGIDNSFAQLDCIELTLVEAVEEVPVIAEGYTGDLTWALDANGKLTFEVLNEVGKMKKYVAKNEVPWVGYMDQITAVEIPEGVTRISAYTFYGATNLTSVVVPSTVKEISAYAFKNSGLTSVTLTNGLATIGDSAFYGTGITEIVIPETVETVGEYAFARSGLTAITFTGNAPTIGEGAFNKIAVTASYPAGNETWTEEVLQNYGGTVTWTAN